MNLELERFKKQQEQARYEWNEDVNQALELGNFDKLAHLLTDEECDFIPYDDFFNLLVSKFANTDDGKGYIFLNLFQNTVDALDSIIPRLNINLSDDEFEKIMKYGGFANTFRSEDEFFSLNFISRVWEFENIKEFLTRKFQDKKGIDMAINHLLPSTPSNTGYIFNRTLIGCFEILRFSPQNHKQYVLNKITENITKNGYAKTMLELSDFTDKLWSLLEHCSQYNIHPSGVFWEQLSSEINKKINQNYSKNEIKMGYKWLKEYFSFLSVKGANIPKLLNIQWTEKATENYFSIYSSEIKDQVALAKKNTESFNQHQSKNLFYFFKTIVKELFNTYENMLQKKVFDKNTEELFLSNIGNLFTCEDIDFLEDTVLKGYVKSDESCNLLNYLSEIKKIKLSDNFLKKDERLNSTIKFKI